MQNLILEIHRGTKFWQVFCKKLPKAAKFRLSSLLTLTFGYLNSKIRVRW